MLRRLLHRTSQAALLVGGLAILAITLLGGFDILFTALLGRPIHGVFEATQTLMVITVFLGLAAIHINRSYIGVEVGYDLMPRWGKRASEALTLILMLGFFGTLAWRGWGNAVHSWRIGEYTSGIVQFPIYPAKFAIAIGCTLAVICCLVDLARGARFRKGDDLPE
jgi:TRAP-type C4-dicarboxylate transport system permease small subunit